MAITLADFTKIWASTSPLTPYSFSESNYREGWNFIGGTPPSRQMWDSIQNQNDEKLKYIVDNFLPTSGGTMTGNILVDGSNGQYEIIKSNVDSAGVCVSGGDVDNFSGASLQLYGQNQSDYAGRFYLRASNKTSIDDTDPSHTNVDLIGRPNGSLTWGGVSLTDGTFLTTRSVTTGTQPASGSSITAPNVSGYQFVCWVASASNNAVVVSYINPATNQTANLWYVGTAGSNVTFTATALYVRKW